MSFRGKSDEIQLALSHREAVCRMSDRNEVSVK